MTDYQSAITHCDNCGCDWLDNGLNPIGCPYCKLTEQSAEIDALREEVERWKSINAEQVKLHVKAEIRAERLAEALEMCLEMEERTKVIELAKAALAALSEENE